MPPSLVAHTKPDRKICSLEALAELLEPLRLKGSKIVHCHGVFDLLHIGHIRHFEEAKQLGDVLVVTVTPDVHVNKGPHRPVFGEKLRAEAIAALGAVDWVAVNRWPNAVETLRLLKPDLYVKGPDYRNLGDDYTGGILEEKAAVESVNGKLVFTDDITFSSSGIVNRFLPVFSKEVSDYLVNFSARYSRSDIFSYFERAKHLKVLVVGEAIIDEYHYCEAIGKSSKEPTLAVKSLSREKFLGGILMAANHLSDFNDHTSLVTLLGSRDSEEEFIREKLSAPVHKTFLKRMDSPTIVKRRFIESYFFSKLFEVYDFNDGPLTPEDNEKMCAVLREKVPQQDLVIVVDFGHGAISNEAIELLCRQSKFLALNVQCNAGNLGYHTISTYPRADYISMTEAEARLEARDRRGDLRKTVQAISKKLSCDRVVVTRGRLGNLSYDKKEGFLEVPAFATQVVDRVGAGDAVLSISSLLAAQRAPMEMIGFVGNAVGALAVATVGNRSPVKKTPLLKYIESLLK